MNLFRSVSILVILVSVALAGCSSAAREVGSNTVPLAKDVTLSASDHPAHVGTTLQGGYRYLDTDDDGESGTLMAWLRDGELIDGANQDNYTATLEDSGKELKFRVIPAAGSGKSPGEAVVSPSGILIVNSAPTIAGLTILGVAAAASEAYIKQVLTVKYTFSDVDGDRDEGSLYQWLRNYEPINGATGYAYTVTPSDIGSAISVRVTPKDNKNMVGTVYVASAVNVVNMAPVASNVRVTGKNINQAGEVLSVSYTYTDLESEVEAGSQFRWLRDGVAITNATNSVYTLTLADAGKTLRAEVTPLAGKGASPGLPVLSNPVTITAANVALAVSSGLKRLHFNWAVVNGATHYRVLYSPDGVAEFLSVSKDSSNLTAITYDWDIPVHRINWPQAQFMLEACDVSTCLPSASISALNVMLGTIGYFKASNTGVLDQFGSSVALSADGNTLAVGAPGEDSASAANPFDGCAPVNPNNCARASGAVYVYTRSSSIWIQQAYVKASNIEANDHFGIAVALSADGNMLAVGANQESSNSTGINSVPNVLAPAAGAVYVYTRSGDIWSQRAYVKASNAQTSDSFGTSVALRYKDKCFE